MDRRIVSVAGKRTAGLLYCSIGLVPVAFLVYAIWAAVQGMWLVALLLVLGAAGMGGLCYLAYRDSKGAMRMRVVFDPEARTVTFEHCRVENYRFVASLHLMPRTPLMVCPFEEILAVHHYWHPRGPDCFSVVTTRGTIVLSRTMSNLDELMRALRAVARTTDRGPVHTRPLVIVIGTVLLMAFFCLLVALIRAGLARLGWL